MNAMNVEYDNSQPFFRRYFGRMDGGPWKPAEPRFVWTLRADENRLEVIPENDSARRGIPLRVVVGFTPAEAT